MVDQMIEQFKEAKDTYPPAPWRNYTLLNYMSAKDLKKSLDNEFNGVTDNNIPLEEQEFSDDIDDDLIEDANISDQDEGLQPEIPAFDFNDNGNHSDQQQLPLPHNVIYE